MLEIVEQLAPTGRIPQRPIHACGLPNRIHIASRMRKIQDALGLWGV
jgi:hypothetical protein